MKVPKGKVPVSRLGDAELRSPLRLATKAGKGVSTFCREDTWVRYDIQVGPGNSEKPGPLFERAGPREKVYFDPARTRAAIVTCGGLCPGLNNVIRSATISLTFNYRVQEVLGLRYGYRGLNPAHGREPIKLTPDLVERIDQHGGTILGTSRGAEEPAVMVDFLERQGIDILFCAGGDGTLRGAHAIQQEVEKRGARISVIGIPKTIDNDVAFCTRTFGFSTAMHQACKVLNAAHDEARSALNGIGLVKVMGRDAGFIAAAATLASQDVNFALIPEVRFDLDGPKGFLHALERRIIDRGHALIVVAEGAGQDLFAAGRGDQDASGNVLHHDIGLFLKQKIAEHMRARDVPFDLKYIDPSYIIRAVPAQSDDAVLCDQFARHSVHAAMSGRTDMMVGFGNGTFYHVPLGLVAGQQKTIDPESELWWSVLAATGQPSSMTACSMTADS